MSRSNHQLIRDFFTALSTANFPDGLLADDMTSWTTRSGPGASAKEHYIGAIKILQSAFKDGLTYSIDSITVEDDRAAAEVQGRGMLLNGEKYHNTYVFMFRIRDGRIASVAEHFNVVVVNEKLMPVMQTVLSKISK